VLAHVGYLAADIRREVAHRTLPACQRLEDAQALRVRERTADGRDSKPLVLG
jgi:hypothetical protein